MSDMTLQEWIAKYLTDHGLWPAEAEAVIELIRYAPDCEALASRLPEAMEGYSEALRVTFLVTVNAKALEWLDAKNPRHFARSAFLPRREREKLLGGGAA